MISLNDTIEDFEQLRESVDLECKKAGGRDGKGEVPKDFWETYSAMANTDGGVVLLGVEEKDGRFSVAGIQSIEKVKKSLFDTANNLAKVSVNLLSDSDVKQLEIDGRAIIQVNIRRAARQERPVFLNNNPLGNSFLRRYECDQRMSNEAVKRMLAEQVTDSLDTRILKGFSLEDLSFETIRVYRQIFANRQPEHPWNELDVQGFLRQIGAWRVDRESGENGLTVAGLLMFGFHTAIQEAFPNYMLDYQERPEAKTEKRWVDRVTLDGSWSGNLYDFYRKIFPKLIADVKVPFELNGDQRIDESPIHVALREALCNVLVHADYSDRASVLVVKRPDLFGFRNPGTMRIPVELALQGGNADCRNRSLHQMFRYIGIGDQAGSGIPKILSSWKAYHWRQPELIDSHEPFDQTVMRLRMIDLFPEELLTHLKQQFGEAFNQQTHDAKVALAIAAVENTVSNIRLVQLTNIHPADASRCLHALVKDGMLEQTGSARGAVYHLSGVKIPGPEDVFDSTSIGIDVSVSKDQIPNANSSSPNLDQSSPNLDQSSPNLDQSSPNLDQSSPNLDDQDAEVATRDSKGRLITDSHALPFVDDLKTLSDEHLKALYTIAAEPRAKKKIPRENMKSLLLELTEDQYVTISSLAQLLNRDAETLRGQYLTQMVRQGELQIAFPRTPNDPRQAYTKAK